MPTFSKLTPTEFQAGKPHERYSGEDTRRRVAGSAMLYGGAAAGMGAGGTALGLHRHAGRPDVQSALKTYEHGPKDHPLFTRAQAGKLRVRGAKVAAHPKATAGGLAALAVGAAGAGTLARFRRNEEAGISQGIGRLKAGDQYGRDQARIGKSVTTTTAVVSALASDPKVKAVGLKAWMHRKPLAVGTGVMGGLGAAGYGTRAGKKRAESAQQLRAALSKAAPSPEEIARRKSETQARRKAAHAAGPKPKPTSAPAPKTAPKPPSTLPPLSGGQKKRLAAVGAAGLAALVARHKDRSPTRQRLEGAAAGTAAADAASITGGAATKHVLARQRRRNWTPEHEATLQRHRDAHGHINAKGVGRNPDLKNSPEKITGFYAKYPTNVPGGRAQRALSFNDRPKVYAATLATGALLGSRRRTVDKSLKNAELTLAGLKRHSKYGGAYAGAGLAAGAGTAHHTKSKGKGAATVGGAAAGQGAYQAAGYYGAARNSRTARAGRKELASRGKDSGLRQVSGAQQDRIADAHFQRWGLDRKNHKQGAAGAYREMFRSYPKELPGSRGKRRLAYTHAGRTGDLLGGAVTVGGALLAGHAVGHKGQVAKGTREYGYQERSLAPVRFGEAAVGAAALAWGVPRLRMIGPMAAYGQRLAVKHGGGKEAAAALELASSIGARTRSATGQGEQALRQYKRLGDAIDKVPSNLRPGVATAAGALLVQHARPLHNERFVATGDTR